MPLVCTFTSDSHVNSGGGTQLNVELDLGKTPCLWMKYEATSSGLDLKPGKVEWDWQRLDDVQESLTGSWRILERLPFKRLTYKGGSSTTYRWASSRYVRIVRDVIMHGQLA